jgi:hypothetical protein
MNGDSGHTRSTSSLMEIQQSVRSTTLVIGWDPDERGAHRSGVQAVPFLREMRTSAERV